MDDLDRTGTVSLRLRSDPRMLAVVRAVVRSFGSLAGFDEPRVGAITLAVDESCANIIRHAYEGRTDGEVELTCTLDDGPGGRRLVVRLRDRGKPASCDCMAPPCDEKDLLQPGGLGLRLIHQVMDRVEFLSSTDDGNVLVLTVSCPPAVGVTP